MLLDLVHSVAITTAFIFASQAASEPCQTLEVPLGVINLNAGPSPEFSLSDFRATVGGQAVAVKSMAFDEGPRRILLVLDRAKKLSADTRRAEQSIVETILSLARQDDQFALVSARGPQQFVPFTRDHGELLRAAANEDKSAPTATGALDTVLKNIDAFGSPQPGDAVIAIVADLGGSHSKPDQLAAALLRHHIRFFGIALGPVARYNLSSLNTFTSFRAPNGSSSAVTATASEVGDHHFQGLTLSTGGFVLVAMNHNPFETDSLKDPKVVSRIDTQTKSIFALVAKYSRLQIEAPTPCAWRLLLSDEARKTAPGVLLLYPHELWPTSAGCGVTKTTQ